MEGLSPRRFMKFNVPLRVHQSYLMVWMPISPYKAPELRVMQVL